MFWTSADVIEDNFPKSLINLIKFTQYLFVDANLKFSFFFLCSNIMMFIETMEYIVI